MEAQLGRGRAIILFAIVVAAWGLNWPVTKILVETIHPLWITAIRCWISTGVLVVILGASGHLRRFPIADCPVILGTALLHMVAFSTLSAAGLAFLPASRAVVLAYTTPLWVAVTAPAVLGEPLTTRSLAGVGLGLLGIGMLFNPASFDWSQRGTITGCGLVLAAAFCWALNILLNRAHRWTASALQLLLWQSGLAAVVLTLTALCVAGWPRFAWTTEIAWLFAFSSLVGTVLAYWAMSVVNRSLPALTTALGVTATPLVGIGCAALMLGDAIDASLVMAAVLIIGGIAVSTLASHRRADAATRP